MSAHAPKTLSQVDLPKGHLWRTYPKLFLGVGVAGILLSVGLAVALGALERFYFSYLTAFMYCLSIALGGLFFVLIHHAASTGWSVVVRRIAENAMATLPYFALLFIPVLVGLHTGKLFEHWTHPHDEIVKAKSAFLNVPFFYVRFAIYFGAWFLMSRFFLSRSREQDRTGDQGLTRLMQARSYPSIAAFALTATFASFDWIMSHNPHWYSTMFGVYFFAGCAVSIFAFLCIVSLRLRAHGVLGDAITAEHYHDLGKYLFGFVVFWTYIAFSQFMLIWYANIPEETLWFKLRFENGWDILTGVLFLGHFIIPFFFLLPRTIKRNTTTLLIGAVWLAAVHYLDIYWQVMPNIMQDEETAAALRPALLDLTCLIGVGCVFLGLFFQKMTQAPIVPVKDPRLPESLAFENF